MNATAHPSEEPDRLSDLHVGVSVLYAACVLVLCLVAAANYRAVGLSPREALTHIGLLEWSLLCVGVAAATMPYTRLGSAVLTRVACVAALVGCILWVGVYYVLTGIMYVLFTRV